MDFRRRTSPDARWLLSVLVLALVTAAGCAAQQAGTDSASAGRMAQLRDKLPDWAGQEFFGIAVWQILGAFILILGGLVLKKVSDYVLEKRLLPWMARTRFEFDSLIVTAASKPLGYLFLLAGLGSAAFIMPLPEEPDVRAIAFGGVKVLVGVLLIWFLFRVIDVGVHYLGKLAQRTDSKLDDQLIPVIRKALKATVGLVCAVWIVQLLGYSVSSLLAGLGIGGLAVALALQDTLANFFGSVFIFLDRPFVVGDWIKDGDTDGVVEEIGFRSTRIRTWPATIVSIPNKTMAEEAIDNWSRMPKRRVMHSVGLTYETSAEQMERAVADIRQIITDDDGVDKEWIVVHFTEFGACSLDILVYYFTKVTTLDAHLAVKERINLAIMRKLEEMGLSIAFPTRTLYLEGDIAERMARGISGAQQPSRGPGQGRT